MSQLRPGERCEFAVWLSGEETEAQMRHFKSEVIPKMVVQTEKEHGVMLGPLTFIVKSPGEDRMPQVPEHIRGPNVQLLVVEADVFPSQRSAIELSKPGLVADLRPEDLTRLREITRRAHARKHPGDRLSDQHCDAVINHFGIDAVEQMLRGKVVHH